MKKIVPIRPQSADELKNLVKKIGDKADIIEIWLDQSADELIQTVKQLKDLPPTNSQLPTFLAVCKTIEEKGIFTGSMTEKLVILKKFLAAGGDYVDVDIERFPTELIDQIPSGKLWLSWHDFVGVPENLEKIVHNMCAKKPFLIKLAVTCNTDKALERFVEYTKSPSIPLNKGEVKGDLKIKMQKPKSIFTTMGQFGACGRQILREQNLTWGEFYALDAASKTAEGQPVL